MPKATPKAPPPSPATRIDAGQLDPAQSESPWPVFANWYADAQTLGLAEPSAVTLATADARGQPSCRVVLLKVYDDDGFVIYTNLESRKGREVDENPQAALCFHWMPVARQVRVRGRVERVSDADADAYWRSRARLSQIGAWASDQSRPLPSRETLASRVEQFAAQFDDAEVPRPSHWSGLRVVPHEVEFWQGEEGRLHQRVVFTRSGPTWARGMLFP